MSEPERVPLNRLLDREHAATLKRKRQAELASILAGAQPELAGDEIDELADRLAERLLERLRER